MRISYMGDSPYPNVSTLATILYIQVNSSILQIDCRERQKTVPVHIDVVQKTDGSLTEDISQGMNYVANIDIPAAKVTYNEETGEEAVEPFVPSDFDKVKIMLWTITANTENSSTEQ